MDELPVELELRRPLRRRMGRHHVHQRQGDDAEAVKRQPAGNTEQQHRPARPAHVPVSTFFYHQFITQLSKSSKQHDFAGYELGIFEILFMLL
jgi:uncharacterized protein YkwD